jgi:hypothetical protein
MNLNPIIPSVSYLCKTGPDSRRLTVTVALEGPGRLHIRAWDPDEATAAGAGGGSGRFELPPFLHR